MGVAEVGAAAATATAAAVYAYLRIWRLGEYI